MHIPFILTDPSTGRSIFAARESQSLLDKLLVLLSEDPLRLIDFKFSQKDGCAGNAEGGTVEQITAFLIMLALQDEPEANAEAECLRQLLIDCASTPEVFRFNCVQQKEESWYAHMVERQAAET